MEEGETKITWIRCPECGAKIGIIISVGKGLVEEKPMAKEAAPPAPAPTPSIRDRLEEAGVDVSLLEITEGDEVTVIRPKRFLGDLWGPINEAVKSLGGVWVREGRESHWEIRKEG